MIEIEEFAIFEKEENLFEREYCGVPYWQELRMHVCESIINTEYCNSAKAANNETNFSENISLFFRMIWTGLKSERLLSKCGMKDVAVFREFEHWDSLYDTWTMPQDICAINFIENVRINSNSTALGYYNMGIPNACVIIAYHIREMFHALAFDAEEYEFLNQLEQKLKKRFGGPCISANEMHRIVRQYYYIKKIYGRYFGKLFDKTKVRALVVPQYYRADFYSAYEEAKKRSIIIIELQHGVI